MSVFKHLNRLKELGWFFVKYGRGDLLKRIGFDLPERKEELADAQKAQELVRDLQKLGPTFVKCGQLLSTQYNLLPLPYQEALADLQDKGEFFPFAQVREIINQELGTNLEKIFIEFEETPLAAASLSQVHKAILPSGKTVVVKIQRPGVSQQVIDDLEMLQELAAFIDSHEFFGKNFYWKDKVNIFNHLLLDELNFEKEAQSLAHFKKNLADHGEIIIPTPIPDYTTKSVLTMEYISSQKITTLHPLIKMDLDGEKLSTALFDAYLQQLFVDGFVHVDPHPGNVYLTDHNQIALLDFGMVQYLSNQLQQNLLQLLLTINEGRGEETADLLVKMGETQEDFQSYQFREKISDLVARHQNLKWGQMSVGHLLLQVASYASENGLRLSPKFNVFGKVLTNLDSIVRVLAPQFDSNAYIKEKIVALFQTRLKKAFSSETLFRIGMDLQELFQKIPHKMNEFLENLSKKEVQIKLQPSDEFRFIRVFEKIANRITFGLLLAAMIVGAALLMRVETPFKIFGYPGIAILLFLGALFGGLIFIFSILIYDEKSPKK